ncbi:hypothetical protein FB107DRAFT_224713, partial [Schizophyllum commune]
EQAEEKNAKYRQILETIAELSPPAVPRLLRTALKAKEGLDVILNRIEAASRGQYTPHSFTTDGIDLGAVLYELGGAAAVYAANHSHAALPSLKTMQKRREVFDLRVSARAPTPHEVRDNVNTTCRPRSADASAHHRTPVGVTLTIDEVKGDARPAYRPQSDDILGFCREHVKCLKSVKMGDDWRSVLEIAEAVRRGEVHLGQEITCAAICPLSHWGPIWAIASDGDSTRRTAMFVL